MLAGEEAHKSTKQQLKEPRAQNQQLEKKVEELEKKLAFYNETNRP